jgi:hypothetical protein
VEGLEEGGDGPSERVDSARPHHPLHHKRLRARPQRRGPIVELAAVGEACDARAAAPPWRVRWFDKGGGGYEGR